MSHSPIRLLARPGETADSVHFLVAFAGLQEQAAAEGADPGCAAARLLTGDGQSYDLGNLCAPTIVTWREQRLTDLVTHAYAAPGIYEAVLHWGDVTATVTTGIGERAPGEITVGSAGAAASAPAVALFQLKPLPDEPFQRLLKLKVEGLQPGQSVRLDAAAGQVWRLANNEGDLLAAEFLLTYAKPGLYATTLDLLDDQGFWLSTLSETPIEITEPEAAAAAPAAEAEEEAPLPAGVTPEAVEAAAAEAVTIAAAQPWLPYRNFKPTKVVGTYSRPGGGSVVRRVGSGTWLTARAETVVGGARWYQTAGGDWIAAANVTFFQPSNLRGVVLNEPAPPPPPPPPPPGRKGVVTTSLNVRAQPGTASNNPPIGALRKGDVVTIYEQQAVAGAIWYRIGDNRWVHGAYVQVTGDTPPPPPPPPPPPDGRKGTVTATALNVRARPGVSAGNPPVGVVRYGAQVIVYAEQVVAGETWYRIGDNRWVLGKWVRITAQAAAPAVAADAVEAAIPAQPATVTAAAPQLPFGWVVPTTLDVYGQPGGIGKPVRQLAHNEVVPVLETRMASNIRWYRIAADQWVDGRSIGVARLKARPASIGATERWVGVNLSEQTLVAYEGDRPLYAALIASGLPGTPTVQGIFRTWRRLATGKMAGPGYYIEDVTWTCYFYSGYALHTAYWHDAFGRPRSHGCVNMSPYDAWWVYQWSAAGGPNSPVVYVYWS